MTRARSWGRTIGSVSLWWTALTLILWLLSRTVGQPTDLLRCSASAALLVTVGEIGDWLRRRWHAYRTARRRQPPVARSSTPQP